MRRQAENREMMRIAYRAYRRARRHRRLVPPSECERCRQELKGLHGHHEDYGRPLAVQWLCAGCHRKIHASWEATYTSQGVLFDG